MKTNPVYIQDNRTAEEKRSDRQLSGVFDGTKYKPGTEPGCNCVRCLKARAKQIGNQ